MVVQWINFFLSVSTFSWVYCSTISIDSLYTCWGKQPNPWISYISTSTHQWFRNWETYGLMQMWFSYKSTTRDKAMKWFHIFWNFWWLKFHIIYFPFVYKNKYFTVVVYIWDSFDRKNWACKNCWKELSFIAYTQLFSSKNEKFSTTFI